jgi:hypothetical protein
MGHSRYGHTATLLLDGRVLVAGGCDFNGIKCTILDSAELYDPATGNFSPAGSMAEAREWHTATLLQDGRVLIAGGDENDVLLSSAELYDPATGTFSPTGSMSAARRVHTATLLPDGRVLMAGGTDRWGTGVALITADLYDPGTGTFVSTGSMLQSNGRGTITALRDGRVLAAGGADGTIRGDTQVSLTVFATAELYDPATGEWSSTGSMGHARSGHTATLLDDGRVLIAGGRTGYTEEQGRNGGGSKWISTAEVYDPTTGKFSPTGSLTLDLGGSNPDFTATLLLDGRVLIAGGTNSNGSRADAELYDAKAGRFSATKSMLTARQCPTATRLADGRVLIAGGVAYGGGFVSLRDAELYQP